tara:strand:- start:50111 stop:51496 length:1386 start_codon:yes stop_codon:yes gene_type:complete
MEYLPLCMQLTGQPVLLVGGGVVAVRKARLLLRAGAQLSVVAPVICDEMRELVHAHNSQWKSAGYQAEDLAGVRLVVAATNDANVNLQVSGDASERGIPVNVVDAPELCSVIFPAIVDRNPMLVAISSSGRSPVLARALRRNIEAMLPAALGRLADFAGAQRDLVKEALPEESSRRLFWEQVLESNVAELVLAGREEEALASLRESLRDSAVLKQGEVYLIGAGPGDPDLLTFKAARLLQRADVVLYDRLVNPVIVDMARRDAERIYVGKRRAEHTLPQDEINRLLVDLAKSGKRVVRLKGGDPFVFGRGGEEIDLLARENIPFQVVPGITAANGAACYAGIPLTHRDHAQSVRFVAGYLKGNKVEHDWTQFQSTTETLVFYMGLVGLPVICEQLMAHGRSPETPAALVERATLPEQRVLTGSLVTLPGIVAREEPSAPTLLIIGGVVNLHASLSWFSPDA